MRFYKDKEYSDKSITYMFIELGNIMGIHGENPPLMKTRKKNCYWRRKIIMPKIGNWGLAKN